ARPVEHDEARHAAAPEHEVEVVLRPCGKRAGLVTADPAADHHAGTGGNAGEHVVEDLPADIVVDHVDAPRAVLLDLRLHIVGLVIDRSVVSRLAHQPVALVLTTRDADHAAPGDFRELSD